MTRELIKELNIGDSWLRWKCGYWGRGRAFNSLCEILIRK